MKKIYAFLNLVITLFVIIWNYLINVTGINGNTISAISGQYHNLFTPASYAFSIWGVIFIGLMALGIFLVQQAYAKKPHQNIIFTIVPWLIFANIANGLWSYLFLTNNIAWSIVVMFSILISLIVIIVKLNMERYDAIFPVIAFVWWPISLYAGWITVAAIANVSAYLAKIGFNMIAFNDYQWTLIMIFAAGVINILMVVYRNMREFGLVGVWALFAIFIQQQSNEPVIAITALCVATILFITISAHAYTHRNTNPYIKYKEWKRTIKK